MKLSRILEQTVSIAIGLAIAGTAYVVAAPIDPVPALRTIPYEGYLEVDGVPVNGGQNMVFSLYDASVDGTLLWRSDAVAGGAVDPLVVQVTNGVFGVQLGAEGSPLLERVFSASAVYVAIQIGSAPELLGRQRLVNPWLAVNGPGFITGSSEGTGSLGIVLGQPPATRGTERRAGEITWRTAADAHPFGATGDRTSISLLSTSLSGDSTQLLIQNGGGTTPNDTIRLSATGGVSVTGNQTVSGTATVTGEVRAQGGVAVTGNQTVSGNLIADGNTRGASVSVENPFYSTAPGTEVFCPNDTFVCGLRFWYSSTAGHAIPRMLCCEL